MTAQSDNDIKMAYNPPSKTARPVEGPKTKGELQ